MSAGTQTSEEVGAALAEGRPVVALESTIIAHGLPRPRNLEIARELEEIVRRSGAVPATVAVIDGAARVGLDDADLVRVASDTAVRKLGRRDLAPATAARMSGATTVSATAWLAARAGIAVFATGGLGGVHRGYAESFDESADLLTLSEVPITIVCAGVKSILDVAATLQRLETLNVTVVGYRSDEFPGFYLRSSGGRVDWRVDSPAEVVEVMRSRDDLGQRGAIVVGNPLPATSELDRALHDEVLGTSLAEAARRKVTGQAITPFLLEAMAARTAGASLEANLAAVRSNCALAAEIAAEAARAHAAPSP